MSKPKKPESLSFEEAVAELEDIVARMERGDLPLEEALAAFERGVQLANQSQQKLQQAEQKVQMLIEKSGEQQLIDFEPEHQANQQSEPYDGGLAE